MCISFKTRFNNAVIVVRGVTEIKGYRGADGGVWWVTDKGVFVTKNEIIQNDVSLYFAALLIQSGTRCFCTNCFLRELSFHRRNLFNFALLLLLLYFWTSKDDGLSVYEALIVLLIILF